MSDNFLRLIPTISEYVQDVESQAEARRLLMSFVQQDVEVTAKITAKVQFVDQGSNFQHVLCPGCDSEIETEWWQKAMNSAYETGFTNLEITTPCCGTGLFVE